MNVFRRAGIAVAMALALATHPSRAVSAPDDSRGARKARKNRHTGRSVARPKAGSQKQRYGQKGDASPGCAPWECGVAPDQQQRATEHYEQGNRMFEDSLFKPASVSYRAALAEWDHPAIHYNLGLAQIALDQTIPGYQSLKKALRHNGDALDPDERKQAQALLAQLDDKVARVQVRCDQPGTVVTLDGKALVTGPGVVRRLVLVGEHQLEASKRNHVTMNETVTLVPSRTTTIVVRLVANADATRSIRRWSAWIPWTVSALGAGVATAGLVFHNRASDQYDEYTRRLAVQCPTGCIGYPPGVYEFYRSAQWQQGLAIGAYVAGGLTLLGGLWLAHLNRERIEENEELLQGAVRFTVAPVISGDVRGLVATGSF